MRPSMKLSSLGPWCSIPSSGRRYSINTSKAFTSYWATVTNVNSNRRLDNKFNILEGIQRNWFFIAINIIMIGGQVMIIFVGGKAFHVTPLNGPQWGYSLVLGALSLPMAVFIRLIPDDWVARILPKLWKKNLAPGIMAKKDTLKRSGSRPEDLGFIRSIRGGRVHSLKFKIHDHTHDMKVSMKEKSRELHSRGSLR